MEYKIDAKNKIMGRVASQAALLLQGKDRPDFDPAKLGKNKVTVFNTDKMRHTGKKLKQKIYYKHSGFHGGLKEERLDTLMERDSRLAMKRAVSGMLPKNKLRSRVIKNLILLKEEK